MTTTTTHMTTTTQRINADDIFENITNGTALEQEIERDLIDYIMGLWKQPMDTRLTPSNESV